MHVWHNLRCDQQKTHCRPISIWRQSHSKIFHHDIPPLSSFWKPRKRVSCFLEMSLWRRERPAEGAARRKWMRLIITPARFRQMQKWPTVLRRKVRSCAPSYMYQEYGILNQIPHLRNIQTLWKLRHILFKKIEMNWAINQIKNVLCKRLMAFSLSNCV